MESIIELTSEYEKVIKDSDRPVTVIIIASWCGSCQIMAPILEKVAFQYSGKIKFLMVDAETNKEIAKKYGLDILPIILLFKEGNLVDRLMGTVSYNVLDEKMKSLLKVSSTNNISKIKR